MILAPVTSLTNPSANFAVDYTAQPQQYVTPAPIFGAMTVTQPITNEPQAGVTGSIAPNFFDEFYHRIHIKPSFFDLGNLISNQQRQFEVWNAHFASRTLNAITPSGIYSGLSISGAPNPPLVYGALQSYVYTLTAMTAGDPVIDADFVFDFGAESVTLEIFGRRIVLWLARPDWSDGVTERMEWLTDVLTARDGTEQRVRLRKHARRSLEMSYLRDGRSAAITDTLLTGWSGRKYLVPVWVERDRLSSPVSIGATTVTVTDASLKDYRVGGYLTLWRDETQAEAIEIAAISGNTITLKTPVSANYPAGSSVMPGIVARIDGEHRAVRPAVGLLSGRIRFVDEQSTDRAAAEIGPTWNGYAVLDERPDRAIDVEESWARSLEILDSITGILTVDDPTGKPIIRRTYSWLINGRTAIDRWKKWAAARAGRMNALWLPTFGDDIEIVDTIQQMDTGIKVRNTLAARYSAGMPGRAALRIETTTGAVYHRTVTGITELDADTEAIGIDSSLGVTLPVSSIRRAMWLALARLDGDAVEIHYETDSLARLTATFRVLQ